MITRRHGGIRSAIVAAACCAALGPMGFGQEPTYPTWSKVEAARETREYREKVREGSAIDATAADYIKGIVLPQLGLDANRISIERVRRRIRDVVFNDITDASAFTAADRIVHDFMAAVARDPDADPIVQINAMLLVGELRGKDGKPWPPAAPTLAAAVGDATLPAGVRVAALAGLVRHAEAVRTAPNDAVAALAKDAVPALMGVLSAPPPPAATDGGARSADANWMAARALTALPMLVRSAPKNVAALVAGIVNDPSWSIDVRVRAAAALGAIATPQSGVDAAGLVETIRKLAMLALDSDLSAANRRREEDAYRQLAGGGQGGFVPRGRAPAGFAQEGFAFGAGGEGGDATEMPFIPEQVCRRAAWRLVTLADGLATSDGKGGLAVLLGKNGEAAQALAENLRQNGMTLDDSPTEQSLRAAREAIEKPKPAAEPAAGERPAAKPAAEQPAQPDAAPASPFETSPFGQ